MARSLDASPPSAPRERAPEGTPLYVHLPFCEAKCHYCDFYSVPVEGHDPGAMVEAILAEARLWAPRAPRTVFFGGGTPSLLSESQLRTLLDGLERETGWRTSAAEVTAECNPESLDREKAEALVGLGVTRLSMGIQALDDAALKSFGRVHDAAAGLRAIEAARAARPRSWSVDLMYAWPGQDLAAWLAHLDQVLATGPDHVSAYNLTFEEGTLFHRWLEEGRMQRSPEELELAFFHATHERLAARGLERYEVSNFSTAGHRCRHNVNYWHNGPYVGLGPSAVSKVGDARHGNVRSVGEYSRRVREGLDTRDWEERPETEARLGETWWLGLRLAEGLSPAEARTRARAGSALDPGVATARELEGAGLLECAGERYRLTARGWPLADWVGRRFLAASAVPAPALAPAGGTLAPAARG